jgi:two-component system phosphate regulon response regulator OmpR
MDATVLIAESDGRCRRDVERFLCQAGFRVTTASNGLDCLDKLRTTEPDILVVDLDMLWGGGDGVVALLRESYQRDTMPAVLVVGSQPRQLLSERTGVPHSCCFEKPFALEELLDGAGLAMALRDLELTGVAG